MSKTAKKTRQPDEIIGRKYQRTKFGLHSRSLFGDGKWYGTDIYDSPEDAKEAFSRIGKPILGGLVSFEGEGTDLREYRIVKVISEYEVLETFKAKI